MYRVSLSPDRGRGMNPFGLAAGSTCFFYGGAFVDDGRVRDRDGRTMPVLSAFSLDQGKRWDRYIESVFP